MITSQGSKLVKLLRSSNFPHCGLLLKSAYALLKSYKFFWLKCAYEKAAANGTEPAVLSNTSSRFMTPSLFEVKRLHLPQRPVMLLGLTVGKQKVR